MLYLGVDPGSEGAVACLSPGYDSDHSHVEFFDTPTASDGSRRRYLLAEMNDFLRRHSLNGHCQAAVESIFSLPQQGPRQAFAMGQGLMAWEALLTANGISYTLVTPQRWKKAMLLGIGSDKEASRLRAQQLFPTAVAWLNLKKHHNRAEAALMAEWLRQQSRESK